MHESGRYSLCVRVVIYGGILRILDNLFALFRKPIPRTIKHPPPRSTIRQRDIVLRDAAFLVRRYLAGLPTSRRQSRLPQRAWARAITLCRSAGLIGRNGQWYVQDYPSALSKLQEAHKERADLVQRRNYVSPDDW